MSSIVNIFLFFIKVSVPAPFRHRYRFKSIGYAPVSDKNQTIPIPTYNICVCFYLPCLLQMHSSPAKKSKTEVTGFIHNVSPVKISQKQKPYFTATIQIGTASCT